MVQGTTGHASFDLTRIALMSLQNFDRSFQSSNSHRAEQPSLVVVVGVVVVLLECGSGGGGGGGGDGRRYCRVSTDTGRHCFHPKSPCTVRCWTSRTKGEVRTTIEPLVRRLPSGVATSRVSIGRERLSVKGPS